MNSLEDGGLFWIINGKVYAYPMDYEQGRSGLIHEYMWKQIRPEGCDKPSNYYLRGRVEVSKFDMSSRLSTHSSITESEIAEVRKAFGLRNLSNVYYQDWHYNYVER